MILPFFYLLFSCFGQTPNPKIVFHDTCQNIHFADNELSLDVSVNGNPALMQINFGQMDSGHSAKTKNDRMLSLNSVLFSGNGDFSKVEIKREDCDERPPFLGYFGYDFFRKSLKTFHLNFDTEQVCFLQEEQYVKVRADGYREITSNFKKDGVYVTILIKRKPYHLKLDSGFRGTVAMNTKDASPFFKDLSKSYRNQKGTYSVYPNKWVTLSDNYYNTTITVSDNETARIGIGLMKGFNWIIDFKSRKVYLKKNHLSLDANNVFPPEYQTNVIKNNLHITCIEERNAKFGIGDVVKSVNGREVNSENICELKEIIEKATPNNRPEIEVFATR